MPTDTFTADALAIKDAGGPWPFNEGDTKAICIAESMDKQEVTAFLYACIEWLLQRGSVIEGASDYFIVNDHESESLLEAIIGAVKAELGIA